MTIDYDRLRELLDKRDSQAAGDVGRGEATIELERQGPDIARELLRLRDEIEKTRARITAEIERTPAELQSARITLHAERVHILALCTHLLNGDTE